MCLRIMQGRDKKSGGIAATASRKKLYRFYIIVMHACFHSRHFTYLYFITSAQP